MNISIVIPAYNAERYIGEAIESALNQTHPALEVIVVDDRSTDRTREAVRAFGDRVTLLENRTNQGPGPCRNRGVAQARGEWIAFLDADDVWLPGHLAAMARLAEQHPSVALVFCPVMAFGESDGQPWPRQLECTDTPHDFFPCQLQGGVIQTSTMLVCKEIYEQEGGIHEIVQMHNGRRVQAEDFELTLKLSYRHLFAADKVPTVKYRVHPGQSRTLYIEQLIHNYDYRLRFLRGLSRQECRRPRVQEGVRRMKARWGLALEEKWASRAMGDLGKLVGFGLRHRYLTAETVPYLARWVCRSLAKSSQNIRINLSQTG